MAKCRLQQEQEVDITQGKPSTFTSESSVKFSGPIPKKQTKTVCFVDKIPPATHNQDSSKVYEMNTIDISHDIASLSAVVTTHAWEVIFDVVQPEECDITDYVEHTSHHNHYSRRKCSIYI